MVPHTYPVDMRAILLVFGPPAVGAYLGAKLMPSMPIVGMAAGGFGAFVLVNSIFLRGGL